MRFNAAKIREKKSCSLTVFRVLLLCGEACLFFFSAVSFKFIPTPFVSTDASSSNLQTCLFSSVSPSLFRPSNQVTKRGYRIVFFFRSQKRARITHLYSRVYEALCCFPGSPVFWTTGNAGENKFQISFVKGCISALLKSVFFFFVCVCVCVRETNYTSSHAEPKPQHEALDCARFSSFLLHIRI